MSLLLFDDALVQISPCSSCYCYEKCSHFEQLVSLFPVNCPSKYCQMSIRCTHRECIVYKRKRIFPGVRPLFTNLCYWLYSSFPTLIAVIEKWIILLRQSRREALTLFLAIGQMYEESLIWNGAQIERRKKKAMGEEQWQRRAMIWCVFPFSIFEENVFSHRFSVI